VGVTINKAEATTVDQKTVESPDLIYRCVDHPLYLKKSDLGTLIVIGAPMASGMIDIVCASWLMTMDEIRKVVMN